MMKRQTTKYLTNNNTERSGAEEGHSPSVKGLGNKQTKYQWRWRFDVRKFYTWV